MKHFLQRVAIRTQFPPFVWLYAAVYRLAVWLVTRRLKRIRGVRAVYLRRAMATGRPLYGLSDIDMLVLVDGGQPRVRAAVEYRYELMSRLIPMLGELEVFTPELFRSLFLHSGFYRNRINDGRRQWRRLAGEDLFHDLPEVPSREARVLASNELSSAWYIFSHELLPVDGRPEHLRRYLSYKAVAETARVAMIAGGGDPQLQRDAALRQAAEAHPEVGEAVREVVDLFYCLARRALAIEPLPAKARYRLRPQAPSLGVLARALGQEALGEIRRACEAVPGIERAVLVPRLNLDPEAVLDLDPHALSGATMDAFELVLLGPRCPTVEQVRRLNEAIGCYHPLVNPFYCDGELAVSLRPVWGWTLKHGRSDPAFLACLAATAPLDGMLEVSRGSEVDVSFDTPDPLRRRARTLLGLFSGPDVFRMPIRDFLMLFWEAARAACLASQATEEKIDVPVSSDQVVEALCALTPGAAARLWELHGEYLTELGGEPSDAVRCVHWAAQYVRLLEALLFSPALRVELPEKLRTELTVSVVIVTRNRAPMLRLALESLLEQERPADEVVVVDNGSTDETAAVAGSFADRLKLTVVREEEPGIPLARNRGLEHCTGDILAFMDDDCEADPRWLAELEIPFVKDPHVGAVGGSVLPAAGSRGMVSRFYDSRMAEATDGQEADGAWSSKFSRTSRKRAIWRRDAIPP